MSSGTLRLWTLLVGLFGVSAALLAIAIENKRAYREAKVLDNRREPLLHTIRKKAS